MMMRSSIFGFFAMTLVACSGTSVGNNEDGPGETATAAQKPCSDDGSHLVVLGTYQHQSYAGGAIFTKRYIESCRLCGASDYVETRELARWGDTWNSVFSADKKRITIWSVNEHGDTDFERWHVLDVETGKLDEVGDYPYRVDRFNPSEAYDRLSNERSASFTCK